MWKRMPTTNKHSMHPSQQNSVEKNKQCSQIPSPDFKHESKYKFVVPSSFAICSTPLLPPFSRPRRPIAKLSKSWQIGALCIMGSNASSSPITPTCHRTAIESL